jgi:GNAT superfamily N-acetyltransferase
MADVRSLTPGDLDAAGGALARAFADDPVMRYLTPRLSDEERGRRTIPFYRAEAKQRARGPGAWVSSAVEGVALWAPPGRWRTTVRDGIALAWPILRASGPRVVGSLPVLSRMEKVHPREPHWYLAILGTDPVHQGKGVGGALLQPTLDRCDREGLPAYLESSKESNVPYYERFGWRVTSELALPKGGPTLYLMWRDPQ